MLNLYVKSYPIVALHFIVDLYWDKIKKDKLSGKHLHSYFQPFYEALIEIMAYPRKL
jgi:hypothetical protein